MSAARSAHRAVVAHIAQLIARARDLPAFDAVLAEALDDGVLRAVHIPPLVDRLYARAVAAWKHRRPGETGGPLWCTSGAPVWIHRVLVQHVMTAAAVRLCLPVETWTAWMRARPGWAESPMIAWTGWKTAWLALPATAWTPARIAHVVDTLGAKPPRVTRAFRQCLLSRWEDGRGDFAQQLSATIPPHAMAALREALAFDATGPSMAALVQAGTPLRRADDIARLRVVQWGTRSSEERCGILRCCVYDRCPPTLTPALDELARSLVDQETQASRWATLARRVLVQTQRSARWRDHVVQRLGEWSRLGGAPDHYLACDRVILTQCAQEMRRDTTAAQAPALVHLVSDGWPTIDAAVWERAMAQMIPHGTDGTAARLRHAVQAWWAARDVATRSVSPALAEACLASADRALARWAVVALVPHVAGVARVAFQPPPRVPPTARRVR